MSVNTDRPEDQRDKRGAFEEMAPALGFNLRHTSFDVGEHTDIGLFAGPLASPVMEFDTDDAGDVTPADDKKIKKIIKGWEKLAPTDYCEDYTDFANESYILICSEMIGHVGGDQNVEGNDAFAETLATYPVYTPRKVKVKKFKITHMGGWRVAVTYTVKEDFANGSSYEGNALAVLAKLDQGWRIVIATDHLTGNSPGSGS